VTKQDELHTCNLFFNHRQSLVNAILHLRYVVEKIPPTDSRVVDDRFTALRRMILHNDDNNNVIHRVMIDKIISRTN